MKTAKRRCKCLHCKEYFIANYRSGSRQRYCPKADCRKASKRQSQKAWLAKPDNQDYFRDPDQAARVRQWQKEHPGYWKNTARYRRRTLQETCSEQVAPQQELELSSPSRTLQDLCSMQVPLFMGLISMWTGCTLQEDIAITTRRIVAKGYDILGMVPGVNLERSLYEKTCPQCATTAQSACPVQLDRSPAGPGTLLHPV